MKKFIVRTNADKKGIFVSTMDSIKKENHSVLYEMNIRDEGFEFLSSISSSLQKAEADRTSLEKELRETKERIESLTPNCDKLDYALAASSGALFGILDVFLVGKPGQSINGNITDEWFENRVKDFARLCGWDSKKDDSLSAAVKHLEHRFKIPYDQHGAGDIAKDIYDLSPRNHHFKSLGHNPSLLGLFFSILDQFTYSSHFVSDGELIAITVADSKFELRGNNILSKLFCGFVNWLGHLLSDLSGSSGSKGRGMGIPSPLWTWINDIDAIRGSLNVSATEFEKSMNEVAVEIFNKGFDFRFQTAQMIPVIINELIVRVIYSVRRLIKYFSEMEREDRSLSSAWEACEPFSNVTVKRMLTVAHGTFCIIDVGDAVIRGFAAGGGYFNVVEFLLRLNIAGVGRIGISLYGETSRGVQLYSVQKEKTVIERRLTIVEYYIDGLQKLSEIYSDHSLLLLADDFQNSEMYKQAFQNSIDFARRRGVLEERILKTKSEIDLYFRRGQ